MNIFNILIHHIIIDINLFISLFVFEILKLHPRPPLQVKYFSFHIAKSFQIMSELLILLQLTGIRKINNFSKSFNECFLIL